MIQQRRPGRRRAVATVVGVFLAAATACGQSEEPKPPPPSRISAPPAGAAIDLGAWKLSYPVPNAEGTPSNREPAAAVAPWMVPHPGGGMAFWAPAQGVSTENSDHARTELQSRRSFEAGRVSATMWASVTVLQVPQEGRGIILGQIHGADGFSEVPFVMLRYQDGDIKVKVKQVQEGDNQENYTLLRDVPLNSRFDFAICDLGDGQMAFSATYRGRSFEVTAPVPAPFKGARVRFQAGDYEQADRPAGPADGGRVVFHRLAQSPIAAS